MVILWEAKPKLKGPQSQMRRRRRRRKEVVVSVPCQYLCGRVPLLSLLNW
jgi:hypothetical protein